MHSLKMYTATLYIFIGMGIIYNITSALPIMNTALDGVARITSEPCINPSGQNSQPSPIMTSTIASPQTDFTNIIDGRFLYDLKIELNEGIDRVQNTLVIISQWSSLLTSRSRQRMQDYLKQLQIPACQHNSLSSEVNSKLRVLEQLSNYANFLLEQENDAAYDDYRMNGTALLKNIRIKLMRSMCILRGLLPLSGDEIKNFVLQDVAGHLIPLQTISTVPVMKRAVCSLAVNMLLETLKQIEVSVETGSVRIIDNV